MTAILFRRPAKLAASAILFCSIAALARGAEISPIPPGVPDFSSGNMGWAASSFDLLPPPGRRTGAGQKRPQISVLPQQSGLHGSAAYG